MPKGVATKASERAARSLERLVERLQKRIQKVDHLRAEVIAFRKAIDALRNAPQVGVDQGGVEHVVRGPRR